MTSDNVKPHLRLVQPIPRPYPKSPIELIEEAVRWLEASGIVYSRVTDVHFKIGKLNFYPTSGTINFDNERRLPEGGLTGLKLVLEHSLKRQLPPASANPVGLIEE